MLFVLNQLNRKLFIEINSFAGKSIFLDKTGIFLAQYLPFFFLLFLLYLWFCGNKNLVLYSGYSVMFGLSLNLCITSFYFHPRPFMDKLGILLVNHAPETSFPSDHTTFMLSIAFMLLYFKETKTMGIILSILGILGGLSRIFCGLHYPFDIIGSIFVAIISSYVIFMLRKKLQKCNSQIINLYRIVLQLVLRHEK